MDDYDQFIAECRRNPPLTRAEFMAELAMIVTEFMAEDGSMNVTQAEDN